MCFFRAGESFVYDVMLGVESPYLMNFNKHASPLFICGYDWDYAL